MASTINITRHCDALYVLSDLHADSEGNLAWVREHCRRDPLDRDAFTVFIVPGDVGSDVERITAALRVLVDNYDAVCYVPGNHEAWVRGATAKSTDPSSASSGGATATTGIAEDSVQKLVDVLGRAAAIGVHVGPLRVSIPPPSVDGGGAPVQAVLVLPLHSWYHSGWDREPDVTHPQYLRSEEACPFSRKWGDFYMCAWPPSLLSHDDFTANAPDNTVLAEAFAALNEPFLHPPPDTPLRAEDLPSLQTRFVGSPLAREGDTVLSFSHFLPRPELCIEKQFLAEPGLAKVVGSDVLETQVRRLRPALHLFGHTHLPVDLELEEQRYIQWPLGYRRESTTSCAPIFNSGPLLVHDTALGQGRSGVPADLASLHTAWTKHYRSHPRDTTKRNDLAPWVLQRLAANGFGPPGDVAAV